MTRRRIATLTVAAAFAGSAFSAGTASADTTVIGSPLTLPYMGGVDTNVGTVTLQQEQVGGTLPNPLTSPGTGIVTEWKVRSGDPDSLYILRIFSPAGLNTYVGNGAVIAPAPVPPGTVDTIFTYPGNSLPIKKGDSIAVQQNGTPDVGIPQNTTNGLAGNVIAFTLTPNPPDGVATAFNRDVQHELLLQATVKYCKVPDLIGQAEAAATPALVAGDCTGTVVKKKTSKAAQVGKVIATDPVAGATGPPGTAVKLEVGVLSCKKGKKGKKKGTTGPSPKSGGAAAKKKKKGGCKPKKKGKKR